MNEKHSPDPELQKNEKEVLGSFSESFIDFIMKLKKMDGAAFPVLRRSLMFKPGDYIPAYKYIIRFAGKSSPSTRTALYLAAGLYAKNENHKIGNSFSAEFGMIAKNNPSMEGRFLSLISSDIEDVYLHLQRITAIISSNKKEIDYADLTQDLCFLFLSGEHPSTVHKKWARNFYRHM